MKSITLAVVILAAVLGQPQIDSDGVLSFARATEDYAFMHRRLERRLPVVEVNANPETIRRAIDAMAEAVRAARPNARAGDFFNPLLQAAIRVRITRALRTHGMTPADVRAAEAADGVDTSGVVLRVNGAFPWAIGTAMLPCILEALPPLPPELQYRLVARDLVLIDVHASLVVDILREALAGDGTVDK
jgi:malonyl CoA-acyl carrier protein transacylase